MKLKLFISITILFYLNIANAFSIHAGNVGFKKLENTVPLTIYVDTLCFDGNTPLTVAKIQQAAQAFAPGNFINEEPVFDPNIRVIESASEYPGGSYTNVQPNTVLIIKDEVDNNLNIMTCQQTQYPSNAFKIIFNENQPPYQFTYARLLHEIGHGVGLGHSKHTTSVMHSTNEYVATVQEDEIQGLYHQYSPPKFKKEGSPLKVLRSDDYFFTTKNLPIEFKAFNRKREGEDVPDAKIMVWHLDSINNKWQRIINNETISSTNDTILGADWDSEELEKSDQYLWLYMAKSEDCVGNYANNISGMNEPADTLHVKLYDFVLKSPEENNQLSFEDILNCITGGKNDDNLIIDISLFNEVKKIKYKIEQEGFFGIGM